MLGKATDLGPWSRRGTRARGGISEGASAKKKGPKGPAKKLFLGDPQLVPCFPLPQSEPYLTPVTTWEG